MNKAQLIDAVADRLGGGKRLASEAVDAVLDTITRSVAKGEKVAITGFGAFEKVDRPPRLARNPRTGETVRVAKTSVPKFKPGAELKDIVKGAKPIPKAVVGTAMVAAERGAGVARAAAGATRAAAGGRRKAATKRAAKKGAKRTTARKSTARKSTARKGTAKRTTARRAPARKSTARKSTARKSTSARRAPARKSTARRGTAKKSTARRTARSR